MALVDGVLDRTNDAHSGLHAAAVAGTKAADAVKVASSTLQSFGIHIPSIRIPIPKAVAEALRMRVEAFSVLLNKALATLPGDILTLVREDRAQVFAQKRGKRSPKKNITGLVVSLFAAACAMTFW
eukprot:CAMPEP_0174732640 /NCGR_PEP_ID=MMETSP1094-20130205/59775_1 /TAXON_ID=156173 /ORGANISM="Chrysochromulina brevifilum, Strain UTEX LB 985" /LENGTH=125 /DNA_ID=CAMNT_0015935181 /DNA_START=22 /DNA_END=396 /DNA_ORIENTATION=+